MAVFDIHLACTGERLEIEADNWRDAVRQTGRADACHVLRFDRPYGSLKAPSYTAWFDADLPHGISAQTIGEALECAAFCIDAAERGKDTQQ